MDCGLLSVVSASDLKYIDENEAMALIEKIIETIEKLPKWNGHLYNWYNTITLEPLIPRYISTVDSGKFCRIFIRFKRIFKGKEK